MSNLKIEGLFKGSSKPVEYATGKTVTKFYIDIDADSQYPTIGEFQFFNDKLKVDDISIGQKITVHFNISGRKWEKDDKKGFNQNLLAWKIEKIVDSATASSYTQEPNPPLRTNEPDLPF